MLAIASYNKGEAGMRKIPPRGGFPQGAADFWHLYPLEKLPEETMEYVQQILAAAIICREPKKSARVAPRKGLPMKIIRAVFALSLLTGCHARWFPSPARPGFSISTSPSTARSTRRWTRTLSDDDKPLRGGFRFELPAAGSLIASAKPINPQAQVSVSIHAEGSGDEPIPRASRARRWRPPSCSPASTTCWCAALEGSVKTRST